MPYPRTVTGDDGSQQRLRYGLGEFKPYRWRGIKDWNPAKVLDGWRSTDRRTRDCHKCEALAGEECRTRSGKRMHTTHTGR